MVPIQQTDMPPLEFDSEKTSSLRCRAQGNSIGWIHTKADTPGAKFDLIIKDALGHVKFERKGYGNETAQAGELARIPTLMGEDLEVIVENIKNAKKISLFLN